MGGRCIVGDGENKDDEEGEEEGIHLIVLSAMLSVRLDRTMFGFDYVDVLNEYKSSQQRRLYHASMALFCALRSPCCSRGMPLQFFLPLTKVCNGDAASCSSDETCKFFYTPAGNGCIDQVGIVDVMLVPTVAFLCKLASAAKIAALESSKFNM